MNLPKQKHIPIVLSIVFVAAVSLACASLRGAEPTTGLWKFTLVDVDSDSVDFVVENISSDIAIFDAGDFAWRVEAVVNEAQYPYQVSAWYGHIEHGFGDYSRPPIDGVPLPPGFRIRGTVSLETVPQVATQRRLILSSVEDSERSLVHDLEEYDLEEPVEVEASGIVLPAERTDLRELGDAWEVPHVWRVVVESLHSPPPSCPVLEPGDEHGGSAGWVSFQMTITNLGGYDQDVTKIYPLIFIEDEIFSSRTIFTSCRITESSCYFDAINPLPPAQTATYSVSYWTGAGDRRWPTQIDLDQANLLLFLEEDGMVSSYATYDLSGQ